MSDLIDRQAAIDEIEERKNANGYRNVAVISELNRLEGYIMRLPSAQPVDKDIDVTSNDCISRQMLLEYIHGEPVGKLLCDKYNLDGLIEQFPFVQPNLQPTCNQLATDCISRQAAIDALRMDIDIIPYAKAREYARAVIETVYNRLEDLPSAQPEITYQNCSDALLKMWMDNVLTDGEYNRIMDKLNQYDAERRTDDRSD